MAANAGPDTSLEVTNPGAKTAASVKKMIEEWIDPQNTEDANHTPGDKAWERYNKLFASNPRGE